MFADEPDDADLDRLRAQNDMLLKSRFESIFAKYSEDFSGIGDEIDLNTGQITINNGHLATMGSEKDTGMAMERSASPRDPNAVANGRSMLRAMTLAPDREDSYFEDDNAEDVIHSIETIAGVITISSDDNGSNESEDDFDSFDDENPNAPQGAMDALFQIPRPQQQDSDTDSLFGGQPDRESSPDSLFAEDTPPTSASVDRNPEEQDIISKFGQNVGQDVLDYLATRPNVEHQIEPAWRIPVDLPNQRFPLAPQEIDVADQDISNGPSIDSEDDIDMFDVDAADQLTPSPNKGKSLWKASKRRSKSQIRRDKVWQQVREESEDPLQDGFNSDESAFEGDPEDEAYIQECNSFVHRGVCPWCKMEYSSRMHAMQHLRRILDKDKEGKSKVGKHNINHIMLVRTKLISESRPKGRGSRPSRLLVKDLRTLVELHEAAGYTFDFIIAERFLHTKNKDVDTLRNLYERFRSIEDDEEDTYVEAWTRREEDLIAQLSNRPSGTMDTIRRRLKTRSEREIGSYLAKKWLRQCRREEDIKEEVIKQEASTAEHADSQDDFEPQRLVRDDESEDDLFVGASNSVAEPEDFIKREYSEESNLFEDQPKSLP